MHGLESKLRTADGVPVVRSRLARASQVSRLFSSIAGGASLALVLALLGDTGCSSGSSGPAPGPSSGSGGDSSDASGGSSSSGSGGSSSGLGSSSSSGSGGNCPLDLTSVLFSLVSGDASCPSSFELPLSDCTLHGMGSCQTGTMECKYPQGSTGSLATLDLTGNFSIDGSLLAAPVMNGPVTSQEGASLHCTYSATALLP